MSETGEESLVSPCVCKIYYWEFGLVSQSVRSSKQVDAVPASSVSNCVNWLARAKSVTPLIEACIPEAEASRTMPPEVVGALKETDLFWMLSPVEAGGGGCGFRELLEVIEELSYADASAGWAFMANSTSIAAAGAFCGDEAVDVMFMSGRKAVVAGMFGPGGKAVPVKGGYRAQGKFAYGSGCAHADWFGGGMLMTEKGQVVQTDIGPEVRVCFVPREGVQILDNWHVAGLSATGSFDYEIPECFVPEQFTMHRASPVQQRGSKLFSLGFAPVVSAGHAGVVMGTMKRILQEIANLSGEKKRVGYPGVIGDFPTFMQEFSYFEATYMAARDYVIRVFDEAEATVKAGEQASDYQVARFRQVGSWIHKIGADVARACYVMSSSEGFRGSTYIGRAFRDMFVATNHLFVDPVHLVHAAPAILNHYRAGLADR